LEFIKIIITSFQNFEKSTFKHNNQTFKNFELLSFEMKFKSFGTSGRMTYVQGRERMRDIEGMLTRGMPLTCFGFSTVNM
jgi:hypothetical protein